MINILDLKDKKIKIIGHGNADFDCMTSGYMLEYILKKLGITAEYIIPDNKVDLYFNEIAHKYGFDYTVKTDIKNEPIFLVDHTGKYQNEVVGCFDHHPEVVKINNNYENYECSSCAKIIYDWAISLKVSIPKEFEILTAYACYMDTVSFSTTKGREEDKIWAETILSKYGININDVVHYCYCLTDISVPVEEYAKNGEKIYQINDKHIKSSYILTDFEYQNKKEVINVLRKELSDDIIAYCILFSNMKDKTTTISVVMKEYTLTTKIDKVLSRGKDVIPAVLSFILFKNDGTLTEKLISKNIQVATMESCTSGLIASNITDYEGASQILKGSSITYSNEAKMMAGVSSSIISEFGVYSKETAIEMAWNTKNRFHSDIGIGVTGSFGNVDPANKDSVPGIVYFNISYKKPFDFMLEYHDINLSRKEMKQKTVDIILATVNLFVPNKE